MESLRRYKTIAFALAYSMGLAILLYGQLRDWAYDDPFITFRYAENLARGLGFVYNSGERVLSTTTPLFALLLAVLSHSGLDLPHLANLIGALSLALGGLALWDLARTWKTPLVGWVGLLLYPSFSLLLTTLGSEMPLYLAFCLGAFAFYARRRYHLTALFIALAVLTRADGALVGVILAADYLIQTRRPSPGQRFCLSWSSPSPGSYSRLGILDHRCRRLWLRSSIREAWRSASVLGRAC